MSAPRTLEVRDCGRSLSLYLDQNGDSSVTLRPKARPGKPLPRAMAYACGRGLALRDGQEGAFDLWLLPMSPTAAVFEVNPREAEQISQWAGIPLPSRGKPA